MTPLLEAEGLALQGRLQPTSLTLHAGELVCLIGPNGSGKTSLLHALAGVGTPAGTVRIAGHDPKDLHPDQRQRLFTFLGASRDLKWPLTGDDLIALGLPPHTSPPFLQSLIRNLHLEKLVERRVDQLSTGERSRILIARALAAEPRLLLLDEPTANLDPLWQLKLMTYLRGLTRTSGQAVLMAVHDLELACGYADRLVIMNEGELQADGDPRDLLAGKLMPEIFGIVWSEGAWKPAP